MPVKPIDADHWLERAKEARMLKVAEAYERLAKYSEQTAGRSARSGKK